MSILAIRILTASKSHNNFFDYWAGDRDFHVYPYAGYSEHMDMIAELVEGPTQDTAAVWYPHYEVTVWLHTKTGTGHMVIR